MTTHAAVAPAVSIRTTERTPPADLVVGIGMSSRATAAEVRELVERTLVEHDLDADRIALIATRVRFAGDDRLRLGPPVVGIDDARLEAMSEPCTRTVGIRARVAETAAHLAAAPVRHAIWSSPVRRT